MLGDYSRGVIQVILHWGCLVSRLILTSCNGSKQVSVGNPLEQAFLETGITEQRWSVSESNKGVKFLWSLKVHQTCYTRRADAKSSRAGSSKGSAELLPVQLGALAVSSMLWIVTPLTPSSKPPCQNLLTPLISFISCMLRPWPRTVSAAGLEAGLCPCPRHLRWAEGFNVQATPGEQQLLTVVTQHICARSKVFCVVSEGQADQQNSEKEYDRCVCTRYYFVQSKFW